MYHVRCLRCDYSAETETLGRVFRLEEEHRREAGERHFFEWEERDPSTASEPGEVDEAGEPPSEDGSGEIETTGE